jgi:alginate O-acetyltransferase complex protein AlgJ
MALRKHWLLVVFGLTVLSNFISLLYVRVAPLSVLENGQLVTSLRPPSTIVRSPLWFKESLSPYIQDTAFFRETAIKLHCRIKLLLGDEPNSDVYMGKQGWLYLGSPLVSGRRGRFGDPYSTMLGNNSFDKSNTELERISKLSGICERAKTRLIILLPPNKESIYREYLPVPVKVSKTSLDMLEVKFNDEHATLLPAKSLLLESKARFSSTKLYYKRDSHWNFFGASSVASRLIDEITRISGRVVKKPKFSIIETGVRISDLSKMNQSREPEVEYGVKFDDGHVHQAGDHFGTYGVLQNCTNMLPNSVKILVFRDSFFTAIEPFFMHSNVKVVSTKCSWNFDAIRRSITVEQPDVVIFEKIERNIGE